VAIPNCLTAGFLLHGGDKSNIEGISIDPVTAIPLEEVVLMALSHPAYTVAQNNPGQLRVHLAETKIILRQGCTFSFNPYPAADVAARKLAYKVILATPVHQGYVDLENTQLVVAVGDFDSEEESEGSPIPSTNMAPSESDDDEDSDIDESFLLSSLAEPNGPKKGHQQHMMGATNSTSFKVIPLETRQALPMDELCDLTILVRTADLARLGIFSGDWVSLCNFSLRIAFIQAQGSDFKPRGSSQE
jgi:hypothetical protein